MDDPPRSLYIHVPFCAHRCGYCDFVTTSHSPQLHDRYVTSLIKELELQGGRPGEGFDTIFVGGGTPTLLQTDAMDRLQAWLSSVASAAAEITIECNPETVDMRLAHQLAAGVTERVSLGAQSFDQSVLSTLERRASPDVIELAVSRLRDAGIKRLSMDLIWGVPGQDMHSVSRDIKRVLSLGLDHLSAYELEFKPGTKLAHRFGMSAVSNSSNDDPDDLYDLVIDTMLDAGWQWYETANFARIRSERCRHNLAYWKALGWIAVGVGAVGMRSGSSLGAVRRSNLPNIPRWMDAIDRGELPPARIEHIDERTLRTERVMLALRLDEPIQIEAADLDDGIVDMRGVSKLEHLGLALVTQADKAGDLMLNLTRRGRMLQGTVGTLLLDP